MKIETDDLSRPAILAHIIEVARGEDPNSVFMTLELDSHRAGGQGAPL